MREVKAIPGASGNRHQHHSMMYTFNLQDQLTTLEHQFAQDSTAQLKPAEAKIVSDQA
jgi:hypothetical protein